MAESKSIRLELTQEQKAKVKAATGKGARTIEFSAQDLEKRIAPMKTQFAK